MNITSSEINIKNILGVSRDKIPRRILPRQTVGRYSDCFVYILSGHAEYTFDTKKIYVKKGNILYLARGSIYQIDVDCDNYTFIFIDFNFDVSEHILFESNVFSSDKITASDHLFIKMNNLWPVHSPNCIAQCKSMLYEIYSMIILSESFEYLPTAKKEKMQKISEMIIERYSDPMLGISELAAAADLSEVHFRRLFGKVYHMSPLKFITEIRINKAKQLLNNEHVKISEIALLCGFTNIYYFSRVFKEKTGFSPLEYKKLSEIK